MEISCRPEVPLHLGAVHLDFLEEGQPISRLWWAQGDGTSHSRSMGSHCHPHAAVSLSIPHSSLGAPASQAPGMCHCSCQSGLRERNSVIFFLVCPIIRTGLDTLVTSLGGWIFFGGFYFFFDEWLIFCLFSCFSSTETRSTYR